MIALLKVPPRLAALIIVIAATSLVYWPAQRNGFVWDDTALVLRDPLIRSWRLIPESFRHFLFIDATASNFYRPLQRLTFLGDYAFWAFTPKGYHISGVFFHVTAALALFSFLITFLPGPNRAWWGCGVALLWAVHPVHTSAVTYISGRADPLAATFGFCALALALSTLERPRHQRLRTVAAACCFLGALLSKESGVTALLVWFMILIWRKERREVLGRWAAIGVAILAIYGILRFSAEKTEPPRSNSSTPDSRAVLIARACAEYAGLLLVPTNLRMERDVATDGLRAGEATVSSRRTQTFAGAMLIIGLGGWWLWARRRAPLAALALLAFAIAYLPISNLFPLNATVAEHWLYVPSAFLFAALAVSLGAFPWPRRALVAFLLLPIIWGGYLGFRTWKRQGDWLDQRTFLTRTIEAGGDSARMRVNLGQLEAAENRNDEALKQFRMALGREPDLSFALLGVAAVDVRIGRYDEARVFLARAERHPEVATEARQVRVALEYRESRRDTTELLREAADLTPQSWPPRKRYVTALAEQGKTMMAVQELRKFLEGQPFRAETWRMLGELLEKLGDRDRALAAFEEACKRDVWENSAQAAAARLGRR